MKNEIIDYVTKYNNKRKENLKYDFMPNLLEIIERPAHIGGKVIIWSFFAFLITVIIWAAVSKVDVVVTASGTVVPIGNVSVVQAGESGIITDVSVNNGQHVNAGDILAVIDSGTASIDEQGIQAEVSKLEKENEIYQMVLDDKNPEEINIENTDETIKMNMEYIIRQEQYFLKSLSENSDENYVSNLKEKHKIEILGKIVANNDRLKELNASLRKTQKSLENGQIKAQVSGYVTDLTDGLKGQVVSAGNRLLTIVPDNAEMELQCYVKNSDIADISVGKSAVIKLNAYPYSDYGTLKGKITYISDNAVSNENMQNMYAVKVSIENKKDTMKLKPGMTAAIEVNIKKRSVLDYFLDPIKGAAGNAMKEK